MTMPMTASVVKDFGAPVPSEMTDEQLDQAVQALRQDLPGVVELVEEAIECHEGQGGFSFLSRQPAEAGGREKWDVLVGRSARLFASPFSGIIKEHTWRSTGRDIAFVNCCIIAVANEQIDPSQLFALQISQQITPDC